MLGYTLKYMMVYVVQLTSQPDDGVDFYIYPHSALLLLPTVDVLKFHRRMGRHFGHAAT